MNILLLAAGVLAHPNTGHLLLATALLFLGLGSGLRAATVRTGPERQHSDARDTMDRICSELAAGSFHHTIEF